MRSVGSRWCSIARAAVTSLCAKGRTPLDAYKGSLEAAATATTSDALFPFISTEWKSFL